MRLARLMLALAFTLLLASPAVAGVVTADVSVTKTDSPDPQTAGGTVTYTITIQNLGPGVATGVALNDPLPPGTFFVSASAPAGWTTTTPAVNGTGTVTATRAALTVADGSQAFAVTVTIDPATPGGTTITNTAAVTSGVTDPNAANNSASASTTVVQGSPPPTPVASLVDAATARLGLGHPLPLLGFAALLIGALGILAVVNVRGVVSRR